MFLTRKVTNCRLLRRTDEQTYEPNKQTVDRQTKLATKRNATYTYILIIHEMYFINWLIAWNEVIAASTHKLAPYVEENT